MFCTYSTLLILHFYVVVSLTVVCQDLVLNSTVSNGDTLCPGETKSFICETRGSGGIAWTSEEYIGMDLRLEFNTEDSVNLTRISNVNSNVVATFLHKDLGGATPVLISRLSITVLSTIRSHSVTCIHTSHSNRVATITFQPLGTCI